MKRKLRVSRDCSLLPDPSGDIGREMEQLHAVSAGALSSPISLWKVQHRLGPERVAERDADRALARAIQRREAQAGEQLYDALIAGIDRAIVRTLGPRQPEHDDLVQATFEQVVNTLVAGSFRHECSLRSWAVSIASHLSLNAIRARCRERSIFDRRHDADGDFGSVSSACTEHELDTRRALDRLRVELAIMNEERAQAVILFHVLEYDLKQLADVLGISVAAAQSRVARGRRELVERMARDTHEGSDA